MSGVGPALVIGAAILSMAPATRKESLPSLEELFKWGEYDSLIKVMERRQAISPGGRGALETLASRADSSEEAKVNIYLGVAYWAMGRTQDGIQSFTLATHLDRDLRLDPLYSTTEMVARFEQIAEAERQPTLPIAASGARGPASLRKPGRAGWILLSGAAVVATAGTYYLVQSRNRPTDIVTTIDPTKQPR